MRVRVFFSFILIVLFVVLGAVGCKKETDQQPTVQQEQKVPQTQNEANQAPEITDSEITAGVKAKLNTDESVAARNIDVDTRNGVVTLRGTVGDPTEVERAVELARTADGVRVVHSFLKTEPQGNNETDKTSNLRKEADDIINEAGDAIETGVEDAQDLGSDAAITAQIKWKLAKDKLVQASDIDVATKDRRVVLTGTVGSKQEAQRALQIAQSVQSVVAVDSNLRIQ